MKQCAFYDISCWKIHSCLRKTIYLDKNYYLQSKKCGKLFKACRSRKDVCWLVRRRILATACIEEQFPFALDDFQREAIECLKGQENVLVTAPTGSGKTVIAEAAIYLALNMNKRIFYTTPLKALSNQKFHDCQKRFGATRVGLLTGDITIQRDASILVLTTEIYRNMSYMDAKQELEDSVYAVIFDEFHYMNDRERGTVWEEAVINSPKELLFVALSATLSNAVELKDWLESVHRKTSIVQTDVRPVPLHYQCATRNGIFPLIEYRKVRGSSSSSVMVPKVSRELSSQFSQNGYRFHRHLKREEHYALKGKKKAMTDLPSYYFLIRMLSHRKMLPCIVFIFSRAGCDRAARELGNKIGKGLLLNRKERQQLSQRILQWIESHPEICKQQEERLELLQLGISVHHAGLLPIWKRLVEELFIDGLVKVVFATETLAAGINMPARTTVITSLTKRGDNGMEELSISSFQQMAGRAGRRGKDSQGFCVVLLSFDDNPKKVFRLATGKVESIVSKFLPTYSLVLNLLQNGKSPQQVKEFLAKSFGNFMLQSQLRQQQEENKTEWDEYQQTAELLKQSSIPFNEFNKYQKLQQRLKMEKRTAKYLQQQLIESSREWIQDMLPFASDGIALLLKPFDSKVNKTLWSSGQDDMEMAWLVTKDITNESNGSTVLVCITQHNYFRHVDHSQVFAIGDLDQPILEDNHIQLLRTEYEQQKQWISTNCNDVYVIGTPTTATILEKVSTCEAINFPIMEMIKSPEWMAQRERVAHVQSQLENLTLHHHSNRQVLLRAYESHLRLQKKYQSKFLLLETTMEYSKEPVGSIQQSWDYIQALMKTLCDLGFTDATSYTQQNIWYKVTPLGKLCSLLRGENEVWLSLVLGYLSGHHPSPDHLIGTLAAVIGDPIREDAYIEYEPSVPTRCLLEQLSSLHQRVLETQNRYGVECVARFEWGWSGIAEAWVKAPIWEHLVSKTSLDEGDICRNLRRVLDVLRQIPKLPNEFGMISEAFRSTARQAISLAYHFPICDDITYAMDAYEMETHHTMKK